MAAQDRSGVAITIHGLDVDNRAVRADVFLQKCRALLTSLRACDRAENPTPAFRYMIADLRMSSAHARLEERPYRSVMSKRSGAQLYHQIMVAVYEGDKNIERYPPTVVKLTEQLSRHAGETFSHAELAFDSTSPIRIDNFFEVQARRALRRLAGDDDRPEEFYSGIAFSSFDGVLRELDSRGSVVRGKVILTAGGREIDCIFSRDDIPEVRECFERRSIIEAVAHYDGSTPLPVRLDVRDIIPIKKDANLQRWRGALRRRRIPTSWRD
jgi:hypothetical protein